MSDSPDTPGCHPQLLEAAGPGLVGGGGGGGGVHGEADLQYSTVQHSAVQYSGSVHGETDRGELGELGQVVEDGVESHRAQEVAARVLLSVITSSINHLANLAKI